MKTVLSEMERQPSDTIANQVPFHVDPPDPDEAAKQEILRKLRKRFAELELPLAASETAVPFVSGVV